MIRIVTDGSADMPEGWEQEYEIHVLPLSIQFGDELYLQGRDVTVKNFYKLVIEKRLPPKTSLPSPHQIMDFYRSVAQKGDEILSIHLASKMSGTFSAVQAAAKEIMSEIRVHPFDSGAGSAALGFMCREARLLLRNGWSLQAVLDRLGRMRGRLMVIFTMENLEFALLSGRINRLQTAISSLLQINPIIILKDGLLDMAEKVRTRHKALERMLEEVYHQYGKTKAHFAIVHAAAPETAQVVVEKIKTMFPSSGDIVVTELAIPVAAHLGPGTIGIVAYPVDEE